MQFSAWRRFTLLSPVAAMMFSLVVPFTLPLAASAQDDGIGAPASEGGVARIDAISGDVAIQRGDATGTLAAVPNAPVLGADYVMTGETGRAEVGFDGRSAARLGENVQIRFTRLDPGDRQMQLAAGTIDLRLFGDTDGESVIDTPSISIVPRTAGSFRVAVEENGETSVTVRTGRADIVTPQGTQPLEPGSTLLAYGPAANPSIQTQPAIAFDNFDNYNHDRDHIYLAATAASQYVNSGIQGVGDLAANGDWVADGTYGHVWIPSRVAADWAPYRDGNWVWEDGFGWTWIAAEPWGWAPYHYGRWYFSSAYRHWAWYPPPPGRFAPAWSPALVGFIGFNLGAVAVGMGFGNIGWVPLAPFEPFHPWWGPQATFVNNTTIINNTTIVNNNVHYRNLMVNDAMTSVTRENFQNGRFGRPAVVSQEQLRGIRTVPMRGALPIVPGRANLRFTQQVAAPSLTVRPALMDRSFAGRPAIARRTPFIEQQASVSRATHVAFRPESTNAVPYGRGAGVRTPAYTRPIDANRAISNDPWSRFNGNRGAIGGNAGRAYTRPGAPAYNRQTTPAYVPPAAPVYTRPVTPNDARPEAPRYVRAAPSYVRPAVPNAAQPKYDRETAPAYGRPAAPAYNRAAAPAYNRQETPAYGRPAAPAYNRQETPAYRRPSAPAYNRQEAPAYRQPAAASSESRPAAAGAQPATRAHSEEGRRER